jgi:hypothetical protein
VRVGHGVAAGRWIRRGRSAVQTARSVDHVVFFFRIVDHVGLSCVSCFSSFVLTVNHSSWAQIPVLQA